MTRIGTKECKLPWVKWLFVARFVECYQMLPAFGEKCNSYSDDSGLDYRPRSWDSSAELWTQDFNMFLLNVGPAGLDFPCKILRVVRVNFSLSNFFSHIVLLTHGGNLLFL